MSNRTNLPLPIITGAIFALLALSQLRYFLQFAFGHMYTTTFAIILTLILAAAYTLISVCAFLKRRDTLLLVGLGVVALTALLFFFTPGGARFSSIVLHLLSFLAALSLLLVFLAKSYQEFSSLEALTQKLFFVPAAFYALHIILNFFVSIYYMAMYDTPFEYVARFVMSTIFFAPLLTVAGYFFLAWWIVQPQEGTDSQTGSSFGVPVGSDANPNPGPAPQQGNPNPTPPRGPEPSGYGYFGLLAHVLLLMFTCGIWALIWNWRTTDYLNQTPGEPYRNPTKKLLLCIFVPFYMIYWIYKSAQRLDKLAASKGVYSDLSTFCLVMAFLGGAIAYIIMQEKINTIAMVEGGYWHPPAAQNPPTPAPAPAPAPAPTPAPEQEPAPATTGRSATEEIKAYKDLLDSGAITQEEYDAKKRDLLGL